MDPQDANRLVEALGSQLRHGGEALNDVPRLLRQVLETGAWREFTTRMGKRVTHERFETFITTPPLTGIGGSVDLVRRIASSDPVTETLLREATTAPKGTNQHTEDNYNISIRPEQGTSRAYTLTRLQKNHPELYQRVVDGELSANAAAIEAGFRKRPSPYQQCARLWLKLDQDERRAFIDWAVSQG